MALKHESGDADNLGILKRSYKVLIICEKVKVLYLIRKEEKNLLNLRSIARQDIFEINHICIPFIIFVYLLQFIGTLPT